jgi:hypothetical protein
MLAPIIIGGILAVLTFIGLTIADRRDPSRWYDDAYRNTLRTRRSPQPGSASLPAQQACPVGHPNARPGRKEPGCDTDPGPGRALNDHRILDKFLACHGKPLQAARCCALLPRKNLVDALM